MKKSVQHAVEHIKSKITISPTVGIISGSGWNLTGLLDSGYEIPYEDIPGFPCSTVEGHKNRAIAGNCKGIEVIILQGRFHYYEGYNMEEVTFPVEVLSELGIKYIIVTNAAGGINPTFKSGDFMVITDHINLMGTNPLIGLTRREKKGDVVKGDGSIFPISGKIEPSPFTTSPFSDMSQAYDRRFISKVMELGADMDIIVHSGVLAAVSGPSYETPAESEMLWTLGADAVCMSTIPEVIKARYLGIKVLGLSIIANYTAGLDRPPLRHEDVVCTVEVRSKDACRLLSAVIENMRG